MTPSLLHITPQRAKEGDADFSVLERAHQAKAPAAATAATQGSGKKKKSKGVKISLNTGMVVK